MQSENICNKTYNNGAFLFLKKGFALFLFLWCTFFYSQIKVSEGTIFYSMDETVVYIPNDNTDFQENQKKPTIFISSGVQIVNLDEEMTYEIVENKPSENNKSKSTKQLASKITQPQLENEVQQEIVSTKLEMIVPETEFISQEPDVYFSFSCGCSKISVPVSQFNVKHFFGTESYKTSLAFHESKLASVYFKVTEILTAQNKSAFSVRPPPFLA